MRDVDDGYAVVAQPPDQREQRLGLVLGQRGGRLVECDHLRLSGQGTQDLDELPLGRGEPGAEGVRGEHLLEPKPREVFPDPAVQFGPVQSAPGSAWKCPGIDILGDRDVRDDLRFLGDDPDRRAVRFERRTQGHLGTVEQDAAFGGLVVPGEDLQQGRLACAVLSHQRGDLSGWEVEGDVSEGLHGAESFRDLLHASPSGRTVAGRWR